MTLFVYPPININAMGLATAAKQDVIIGHIDGVEAALATLATSAKQDVIIGHIDGVAAALDPLATAAKQDTIIGHVDGVESALSTLNAKASGSLVPVAYDAIVPTFNPTTDVYAYKTGGTGGTTVKTVTITYTDSTKAVIQSVVAS